MSRTKESFAITKYNGGIFLNFSKLIFSFYFFFIYLRGVIVLFTPWTKQLTCLFCSPPHAVKLYVQTDILPLFSLHAKFKSFVLRRRMPFIFFLYIFMYVCELGPSAAHIIQIGDIIMHGSLLIIARII